VPFAKSFTDSGSGSDSFDFEQALLAPLTDVMAGEPHASAYGAGAPRGDGYATSEPRGGYGAGDSHGAGLGTAEPHNQWQTGASHN
jgi:hypothetical protein